MATDKRPMKAVLQPAERRSRIENRGEGEGGGKGSRPDFAGRRSEAAVIGDDVADLRRGILLHGDSRKKNAVQKRDREGGRGEGVSDI